MAFKFDTINTSIYIDNGRCYESFVTGTTSPIHSGTWLGFPYIIKPGIQIAFNQCKYRTGWKINTVQWLISNFNIQAIFYQRKNVNL